MKKYQHTHPVSGVTAIVTEKEYLIMRDDIALRGLVWVELTEPEKPEPPQVNEPTPKAKK